jgi:hypothetical protein
MDYQQEVTKRLLKIKEIGRRAAEDKDLKNFKKEVFEDDGFTPKGLLTISYKILTRIHLPFGNCYIDGYAKEIKFP